MDDAKDHEVLGDGLAAIRGGLKVMNLKQIAAAADKAALITL